MKNIRMNKKKMAEKIDREGEKEKKVVEIDNRKIK